MTTSHLIDPEGPRAGVRPVAEVQQAHRRLDRKAAGPVRQTQYTRGALTAYLWALGRGQVSPVTGGRSDGAPDLAALTAEADAAQAQLEDFTQRTVPRDYVHGVLDTLAWVCGHSDTRP
ncbi:hypothetical protein [Streptomyces roseifaciens]|uniref:hypothetical protein n=1 Tax=Streptomyces roseifaciens TaxID=1488406 RepID=UPI0007181AF9|nr:hypothetical protein [Streptomyces roseifaciens]